MSEADARGEALTPSAMMRAASESGERVRPRVPVRATAEERAARHAAMVEKDRAAALLELDAFFFSLGE